MNNLAGKKVLLIQSEQTEGNATRRYLEENGCQVMSAGSGLTGLNMAKNAGIDLILLDAVLPDIEGLDLCRRFRTGNETRSIPIILIVGPGYKSDRSVDELTGPDGYLVKPFTEQELEERITAVLPLNSAVKTPFVPAPAPSLEESVQPSTPLQGTQPRVEPPQPQKIKGSTVSYLRPVAKSNVGAAPGQQDHKPSPVLPFLGAEDTIIDPATGLFGRPQFEAMFSKEFKRAWRFKQQLSCMLIDVEDQHEERAVDESTIRSIIGHVQKTIREVDIAAWWSGESIIVLLPNTIRNDAVQAAARILEAVANKEVVLPGSANIAINIGVAGLPDKNIDTEKKLIEAAAAACKRAGELMVPRPSQASLLRHRAASSAPQPSSPAQKAVQKQSEGSTASEEKTVETIKKPQ
jgi:diguanylate cyclase (GGDEF)-like protein